MLEATKVNMKSTQFLDHNNAEFIDNNKKIYHQIGLSIRESSSRQEQQNEISSKLDVKRAYKN